MTRGGREQPRTRGRTRAADIRARAATRRRRRVLGVEAIVDVALGIVDREGVDEVSMRRVAAEFDTGPASLYAHVANKDELLRLVLDRVIEEIYVPDGDTWQDILRGYAHNTRAVFARHGDIARITFGHIPSGEAMLVDAEKLISAMVNGGVPPKVATWSLDVLAAYIAADAYEGFLVTERSRDGVGRSTEETGEWDGLRDYFATLPQDKYPYLLRNLDLLMGGSSEERFAFGIDLFIDGMAGHVRRRSGRAK